MAVLFMSGSGVPIAAFFYRTPPRKVVEGMTSERAIASLQSGKCKYALVPIPLAVPQDLEIRAERSGWALLQRRGQMTRSDRRKARHNIRVPQSRSSIW